MKQNISLKSRKLARIIKQCKDLPGHTLFEYIDINGDIKPITSELVNAYIKSLSDNDFTAKDFRTRHGTVYALLVIHTQSNNDDTAKLTIPHIIDAVAEELGNTRAVCKKYYIHPMIFELYESNGLEKIFEKFCRSKKPEEYEKALCSLLEKTP